MLALPAPIACERLVLRVVEESDIPDLLHVNGDDEVTRLLPYATWHSRADGKAWFDRMSALHAGGTGLQFVIVERRSGRVIGTCLLFHVEEASARAEIGYALGRAQWGKGIMREALSALITHAFDAYSLHRLEAEVDPRNLPSNRLLARLGFTNEGLLRQRWLVKGRRYDSNFYGLLREDWAVRGAAAT